MKALCGLVRALTLALLSLCLLGLRGSRAASLAGLGDSDAMLGPEQLGGVANFSTFLLDRSSGVLFLGGRDAILAVNTNNMAAQPRKIVWNVPEEKRKSCVGKGKTEGDCNNYIRLLEFLGDGRIYACGTYAFDPQCAFLNMSSFSLERGEDGGVKMETGKGKCPFEPSQHYTAVMADGVLYTAATSNFLGTLFDISRATGPEQERIRTERSINWLSDPEFVSSAFIEQSETGDGDDDNIYFFFTEVAKEYDLYTKVKVPRVARVCKADVGGMKTLQRRWTTFLKAQLVCEERGGGRRYNILTDVFTARTPGQPRSTLFYGLFTSQWEREELSAVCVYSLADISSVMDGPFKELKKTCENWINPEPVPTPRPGQCLNAALRAEGFESSLKLPDKVLTFMRDHPLMENSVVAAPLLVRRGVTYTKLAVTRPTVAPGDESNPAVLHLGTDRGELHRVAVVGLNTTLLQEEELFSAQEPVNNILLHKGHVLVGSPRALARRGAEGCALYSSCEVCSLAWALGCVWRAKEEACTHRLTGSGPGDEAEALRLCHGGGEGRCSASVRELRVSLGLRLLLQCVQVSPLPCSWEHPPHRHTRQHHSHLEVNVTAESLGTYTCICQEAGSGGRDSTPCRRAAYELSLEGPSVGGAVALAGGRHVLAGYILSFSAGAIFSGILLYILSRRRGNRGRPGIGGDNSEKGRDLSASSATPLSPSSASLLSEAVPLTEKRNGNAGGGGGHHTGNGGHYGGNLLHRHGNGNSNGGYANVNSNANVGVVGGVALPSGLAEEGEESEMSLGLDDAFPEAILKSKAPLAPCEESSI